MFLRDSPGFAIVPELAPRASEAIFDKLAMSAFEGTPLEMALRDCGITAVAIVGIATEIGIEPTARHAADPDRHRGRLRCRPSRCGETLAGIACIRGRAIAPRLLAADAELAKR